MTAVQSSTFPGMAPRNAADALILSASEGLNAETLKRAALDLERAGCALRRLAAKSTPDTALELTPKQLQHILTAADAVSTLRTSAGL